MSVTRSNIIEFCLHEKPNAVLIAGPTASGKSAIAIEIAKLLNGAIINADSMQVYRPLQILSARPCESEMKGVPHLLYGHQSGRAPYSVGGWMREVCAAIGQVSGEGLVPILVGGTGLYFNALLNGLADIPEIGKAAKEKADEMMTTSSEYELIELMREIDPDYMNQLGSIDPQRMGRALQVYYETGLSLSAWHHRQAISAIDTTTPLSDKKLLKFVLDVPRQVLYQRIDQRFDSMMEEGALQEVKALLALDLDPNLPVMKAIGVTSLTKYLNGEIEYEEAVRLAKRDSRRYAKRQMTWFRKSMQDWFWVDV